MTKVKLNMEQEMKKAWDFCWAQRLKDRKEGYDYGGQSYYITATDLELRVRNAVQEQIDGVKYGKYGVSGGATWRSGTRISTRPGLSLLEQCRSWLRRQCARGILEGHNFGRGHISGMRFRPVGEPLSPQEQKQFEKKAKPKLVHFSDPEWKHWPNRSLCSQKAREARKVEGRRLVSRPARRPTSQTTEKADEVTCPRCRKLLTASGV